MHAFKKLWRGMSVLAVISTASIGVHSPFAWAEGVHIITMQDADIRTFIDDVSAVTGKTFLVDPRIAGNVTISSEQGLSPEEVFQVFKNVLRVHGYTAIPMSNNAYRVSLIQGAAQDAPLVSNYGPPGQFATRIFKMRSTDAAELAKLIKPVLHSQGVVTANPGGDVIVVTDFPENIRKAAGIIETVDSQNRVVETYVLRNIGAADAAEALKAIGGVRPSYQVVAIPGSNSLLLEGTAEDLAPLRSVITQMDQPGPGARGSVSVFPLRFADGSNLVEILATLLPAYETDGQPLPTLAYDQGSNAIIVNGSSDVQAGIGDVIRRLDVRRPQVLVEAIIVEISDTAAKNLGVQFALSGVGGNGIPFIGTNFTNQASNVLTAAGAIGADDVGLSETIQSDLQIAAINSLVGTSGIVIGGAGVDGNTLFSGIINALRTDEDSNILSTPFVTTIDNVPAEFVVGQEIPITTGETLGANNINPFRTFERKEVGIKLKVLPQISEGDVIRLEIEQEVSSIAGAITTLSQDFVTNLREITTTVLADNGEVIVLGGLLEDDEQITIESVPILGDAPIIGPLFRNKDRSREKTNLMIFLRPTIIRDASDARPLTEQRINYMRQLDQRQSGRETSKVDAYITPGGPIVSPNE